MVMKSVIYIGAMVIQTHCTIFSFGKEPLAENAKLMGSTIYICSVSIYQSQQIQICTLRIITLDSFLAIWVFTFLQNFSKLIMHNSDKNSNSHQTDMVHNKNLNVIHTIKFHLLATFTAKVMSCGHSKRFLVGMKCGCHFWLCTRFINM